MGGDPGRARRALTVTANDAGKIYGQANPAFSASYSGFVNGDGAGSLGGTLRFSTSADAASPVGAYAITPGGLTSSNYTISDVNGTLIVNPATLTITANNSSKTYGQTVTFVGTEFTTSGLVNGDTVTAVTLNSPGAAASAAVPGSPYAIDASGAVGTGLSNYNIGCINGTLTVGQAALTITANDQSMTYGGSVPILDATFAGLVNGDTSAVVSGLSLTTAATSSNVGNYSISATGGTATNYAITDVNGTLTVGQASLNITANNKSMTYGGSVPALGATFSGLVNGDTSAAVVSGLNLTTTATSSSNVGSYAISATGGTATNYAITDVNGTLTVGQRMLRPSPPITRA